MQLEFFKVFRPSVSRAAAAVSTEISQRADKRFSLVSATAEKLKCRPVHCTSNTIDNFFFFCLYLSFFRLFFFLCRCVLYFFFRFLNRFPVSVFVSALELCLPCPFAREVRRQSKQFLGTKTTKKKQKRRRHKIKFSYCFNFKVERKKLRVDSNIVFIKNNILRPTRLGEYLFRN